MEIKKLRIAAVAAVASCLALGGATASLALGEDAKIASAATVVEHFEERAPGMLIPGNSVYIAIDDEGTAKNYLGTGNYTIGTTYDYLAAAHVSSASAAGAPTLLDGGNGDLTIAIASIVGAMLLGVGAYFFLRKKKEAPRA